MRFKSIVTAFSIFIFCSCGSIDKTIQERNQIATNKYALEIDNNKNLKVEKTKGALTDSDGYKDIGSYDYTVIYDEKSRELFKIKNEEVTKTKISEIYYFADKNLCLVISNLADNKEKRIYVHFGKVVSTQNVSLDEQKVLLSKAKRFQRAFNKSH